jgi:exo-rhamnogalacturonan lyase-like protein
MKRIGLVAGIVSFLLGGSAMAVAAGWEIPLTVQEYGGKAGLRHITSGVPLLPGQAKDVSELHLVSRKRFGRPALMPAQFRVLARWWHKTPLAGTGDNSIRWVLVDFQTNIKANEKQEYVLTNAKVPALWKALSLTVKQTDDAITIDTGAATFVVNRKKFNLLDSVKIGGVELLASTPECGTVLEDMFGEKYYASENVRSVEVIEKGPVRVRVRARGVHKAQGGKGYGKGMYSYDYFMDFYAGSTVVSCDVIIGNNFAKSVGTPCFDDASLWLKLKGPVGTYSIAGHRGKAHGGKLAGGAASACLYQDSNGANTWNKCQGYNTERRDYWRYPPNKTASFRGYKVTLRNGNKSSEIAKGDQATGTTTVQTASGGVVMHMRNFWQQFPKGVEVFGDGRVRVALFPKEYKVPHFLEDATAKGHEIVLQFYGAEKPSPAEIAGVWDSKVMLRPAEIKHIAATGALADMGPFTVPVTGLTKKPNNRSAAYDRRMLSTDGLYGNAYGWQVFGEKWRSCGGHSSRGARQPMKEDNYLFRWYLTGIGGWFLNGDARSRQFRDVRSYRIEDVDPFSYKDWKHFSRNNRSEEWTRRAQAKDAEAQKYSAGRYPRSTFWLPNPAHMTMDLVYDRYLLMGDQRAFENLRTIAAHGGYYAAHYRKVHRATGWSWRALYRYLDLTGDKDAAELMKRCIANFKAMADGEKIALPGRKIALPTKRDRKASKQGINWWFTFVFCRGAALSALHTGDPDALFICKRMTETIEANKKLGGYPYRDFSEMNAVLYHFTGDEKYKKEALGPDGGEKLKDAFPSMKQPACAHWLVQQTPKKQ